MSDKNYLSVYAKSFNWAGFFLPKKTYKKCSTLFSFLTRKQQVNISIIIKPNNIDLFIYYNMCFYL